MTVADAPTRAEATPSMPPSSREVLDQAVEELATSKGVWTTLTPAERIALIDRLIEDFVAVAERWVEASRRAEGISEKPEFHGEEWLAGPYFVVRNLRLLRRSLRDIESRGTPRIPGPVTTLPGGQVSAGVFPTSVWDKVFFPGVTAEVWMEPEVTQEDLPRTQAVAYRGKPDSGAVALVLGAGNVSSIGPMDALYKLFVEDRVVLYKAHPVNEYLGPLLEEAFRSLAERGFFRLVYGGAEEGAYLTDHPAVDEIHITGSDRTYEAIVFGTGEEGAERLRQRRPRLDKRVTAELGNVSPVIVVPGPWSDRETAYQAENIASMLTNNAGFNCNATRVVIQHAGWERRDQLMDEMRGVLAGVPPRKAYYPGAAERFERFTAAHPATETYGSAGSGELPWALIPDLDPGSAGDICFTEEAFCSVFAETALEADSVAGYIDRAVAFANDTLWGTLNVTLIVHPRSLDDPEVAAAVDRAIHDLRYGTVAINHWAAIGYGLVVTPWGAFPGHPPHDIQSGVDFVHNTLMFSRAQKSVVRAPFRAWPKPPWFVSHRASGELTDQLTRFEADRSLARLPALTWFAVRG